MWIAFRVQRISCLKQGSRYSLHIVQNARKFVSEWKYPSQQIFQDPVICHYESLHTMVHFSNIASSKMCRIWRRRILWEWGIGTISIWPRNSRTECELKTDARNFSGLTLSICSHTVAKVEPIWYIDLSKYSQERFAPLAYTSTKTKIYAVSDILRRNRS